MHNIIAAIIVVCYLLLLMSDLFFFVAAECRDFFDRGYHLFCGDELGTFKMPVGTFVARTPQKVKVVKIQSHIVPTAVAGVIVDHPVRRFKLIRRMRKTGNHHHRHFAAPRQPAQTAR